MSYFFTADEHYGHANIIKYCNRPFSSVEEMNEIIIENHNELVKKGDTVIHAGDFCWAKEYGDASDYMSRLNGGHYYLRGSHDKWMVPSFHEIWERSIQGHYVVVSHYAMRTWARSHYNSWSLYGHSHGNLPPVGKSYDVGVDNNNFYPVSFDTIKEIMKNSPDNFNLIKK